MVAWREWVWGGWAEREWKGGEARRSSVLSLFSSVSFSVALRRPTFPFLAEVSPSASFPLVLTPPLSPLYLIFCICVSLATTTCCHRLCTISPNLFIHRPTSVCTPSLPTQLIYFLLSFSSFSHVPALLLVQCSLALFPTLVFQTPLFYPSRSFRPCFRSFSSCPFFSFFFHLLLSFITFSRLFHFPHSFSLFSSFPSQPFSALCTLPALLFLLLLSLPPLHMHSNALLSGQSSFRPSLLCLSLCVGRLAEAPSWVRLKRASTELTI